ncbi:hypothetical protein [Colwellia sp. Bg11-12]|uniref:hypothetical protein n=1 Tax=Colwellia sp. Bg11-12 TaxID=2759817 RepID=UPI0015F49531|nr:hypothetical protein [Colwellia sp. Bg11-12]MBA6264287.1 hypothetical protein [Colwellia sp. Bg11-12]
MNITKKAIVEAIEAGINPQPEQQVANVAVESANDDKPLTLEQVKERMTEFNDAERPAGIRNVQLSEAISRNGNPFIKIQWQSMYLDIQTPEWRDKKGVIFDGQGKLVFEYLSEFGIDENETYIVRSKKVKGADGREYSQWVSLCHISAFDEAA